MSRSDGVCCWLLLVLTLSGFLILILWLTLRPSAPSYTIVDLSIPNANGTGNTTILFGLEVSNPNLGGGVYYSDMNVTLFLFDENAGSMTMPSFYQGHQRTTSLRGGVDAGRRWSDAVVRAVTNGTTQLTMGLVTKVRYKTLWWWSRVHRMVEQARMSVGKDGKVRKARMHRSRRKRKSLLLGG
uniref:Protein NDR1-like n=1 Tax=Elaeis guineensis var. tenera TaxID=51953 RepID=A0A6I9QFR3_ELAGV|nr:protein NDR1-like [Elaeis guineensis]